MVADASLTARVREAAGAHLRAAADRVVRAPWGWAVRTDAVPHWHDLNMVVIDRPAPQLDAEGVEALCDELFAGMPERVAEVWEPETADRLCPAGWSRDRFATFAHRGPVPARPARVEEVARERVGALRRRWLREDDLPAVFLDEAAIGEGLVFSATPTRAFAVVEDGEPVATALLVGGGRERMVEDVYAVPDARGRGLGRDVVRTAVAEAYAAGADLVWLATEDDGPAVPLYRREGFSLVSRATQCMRP